MSKWSLDVGGKKCRGEAGTSLGWSDMHLPSQMFCWIRIIRPIGASKRTPCTKATPTCSLHCATSLQFCFFVLFLPFFIITHLLANPRATQQYAAEFRFPAKCQGVMPRAFWCSINVFLTKGYHDLPPESMRKMLWLSDLVKQQAGTCSCMNCLCFITVKIRWSSLIHKSCAYFYSSMQYTYCVVLFLIAHCCFARRSFNHH